MMIMIIYVEYFKHFSVKEPQHIQPTSIIAEQISKIRKKQEMNTKMFAANINIKMLCP